MRKLLVPTDFSENAQHALRYALAFANGMGADVHLLHTFQLNSGGAGRFVNMDEMVQKERSEELSALIKQFKDNLNEAQRIEGRVLHGYAVDTIVEQATQQHADYVVMGTRGATGLKKVFMGSTTSNVMRNTKVPVLAVPDESGDFSMKQVMIALDAQKIDPVALHPVIAIVQKFGAELSLLHISDKADDDIDEGTRDYLKKFDIPYRYYKLHTSGTADDNILNFAAQKNVDLLCVLNRHRSWFSQLFQTSVSQQLAFQSTIPLLLLHID